MRETLSFQIEYDSNMMMRKKIDSQTLARLARHTDIFFTKENEEEKR